MKLQKKLAVCMVLISIAVMGFAQNVVAVLDFETATTELQDRMPMMTDIFRAELANSSSISVVDRKNTSDTLAELSFQLTGMTSANNVQSIGQMLNADYVILGQVDQIFDDPETFTKQIENEVHEKAGILGWITGKNNTRIEITEEEVTVQDSHIAIVVQMIDVETSEVIATSTVTMKKWSDFNALVKSLTKPLIDKMALNSALGKATTESFIGGWETVIEHSGIVDYYTIKFLPNYRCEVTVESIDRQGNSSFVTKQGRYTFNNNIFSVNVIMRNQEIPHIQEIKWKTMVNMMDDEYMFSAIVPETSSSGSKKVRADFYRLDF